MKPNKDRIPICRSSFLQDTTIELGKRLKSLRYAAKSGRLEFDVSQDEVEGIDIEKFTASLYLPHSVYLNVTIWADHMAVYIKRKPHAKQAKAEYLKYRVNLDGFKPSAIAELIRDSLLEQKDVRYFWEEKNTEC